MPPRPKSICRKAACGKLIDAPGYCEKHAKQSSGWARNHGDKTSAQRGYGHEWRKKRERILHRDYGLCKCRHCKETGQIRIATEVDHVISKANARAMGWSEEQIEDDSNLAAINAECHKRKTQEERSAMGGNRK